MATLPVKHMYSGIPGAPVLTGQVGSLIPILDAFLVNGFGAQTATSVVVSGGVATATFATPPSALKDVVMLIAGATPAGLNGDQKVTAVSGNTFSWATASPDGTATGTITVKVSPLGWNKVFSATDLAVYQSSDPASTKMFLRVDDTSTRSVRVVGYESMSDVSTGAGKFPGQAQISGGGHWCKSSSANSNSIKWTLVGDSRAFIYAPEAYHGTTPTAGHYPSCVRMFGDIIPARPSGDDYACVLGFGNSAEHYDTSGVLDMNSFFQALPRGYVGTGSSILASSCPFTGTVGSSSGSDTFFGVFPSVIDGALRLSSRFIQETAVGTPPRGDIPGFFSVPQTQCGGFYTPWDKTVSNGALAGRTLMAFAGSANQSTAYPNPANGIAFVDITGPWR